MRVPTLLLTARRVSELSQALPLGLTIGLQPEDIEPTKTCYQRIVTAYYTALLASNKEAAEVYSYEECWHDFLLGTVLWGFAYTTCRWLIGQLAGSLACQHHAAPGRNFFSCKTGFSRPGDSTH